MTILSEITTGKHFDQTQREEEKIMKRTLSNRSSTGAQATVIRKMFADAANARHDALANASGGQGNSELDELRAVTSELLALAVAVAAHFAGTDAPLGSQVRALVSKLDDDPQNDVQAAIGGLTQTPMEW